MVLQVVVDPNCCGCEQASRIVRRLRARRPELTVELVVLSKRPPDAATPLYFLDGKPITAGELESSVGCG